MITHDSVHQRSRLLMYELMVAMVRTCNCRPNTVLVYDPWDTTTLECFLMPADRFLPGDAIV